MRNSSTVGSDEVNFYSNNGYGHVQTKVGNVVNIHEHTKGDMSMSNDHSVMDTMDETEADNLDTVHSTREPINRIALEQATQSRGKNQNSKKSSNTPKIVLGSVLIVCLGVVGAMYYESVSSKKPNAKNPTLGQQTAILPAPLTALDGEAPIGAGADTKSPAEGSYGEMQAVPQAEVGSTNNQSEIDQAKKLLEEFDVKDTALDVGSGAKQQSISVNDVSEIRIENLESLARGASDLAHGIAPKVSGLEEKVNAQQIQMESFQRAITQTAQLMVSTQTKLNAVQNEVNSIKKKIDQSDDHIQALTDKINSMQPNRIVTVNTSNAAKSSSETKPISQIEAPAKPRLVEVASTEKAVIMELRLLALNGNRAVVKSNADDKQYVIEAGQTYKNLGTVTSMSGSENKVYGKFANGSEWVIGAGVN